MDDPLLTTRPPGERLSTRIIVDSQARLSLDSQLVRTARQQPVLLAVSSDVDARRRAGFERAGCEVVCCRGASHGERLRALLLELGKRRMTNVLVEGGAMLLGQFFDLALVDEVLVIVAPKLVGGQLAPSPLAGRGLEKMPELPSLADPRIEVIEQDVHIRGRIVRRQISEPDGATRPPEYRA